ncbi:MAG TPA: glycine zipper 2TM domain-containing protein [Gammaproteobacteria bacterium]|nr:glycine zipper 2TM domain-containing protein [Gammaproteobacteria bacterium]
MRNTAKTTVLMMSAFVAWAAPVASVLADPPAHAPAHGWRRKHDPYYVGYQGQQWERDFDISSGSCNRQEIATVIGGVAGGVIANRVADEHKPLATIVGAIAGAVIGNRVGRALDEADRGCFGHALEIGMAGQRITWTNDKSGLRYELSPGADRPSNGKACREYTLVTAVGRNDRSSHTGLACRSAVGVWQVAQ